MPRTGGTGGGPADSLLNAYAIRLYLYARVNNQIWEVIDPKGPRYSSGTLNVIAAQIIKAVSVEVKETALKSELTELGRGLYTAGTKTMDYDDDFYCGNIPLPHFGDTGFFFGGAGSELNPQPQPPSEKSYGGVLSLVAQSISDQKIAAALTVIANKLIGGQAKAQ